MDVAIRFYLCDTTVGAAAVPDLVLAPVQLPDTHTVHEVKDEEDPLARQLVLETLDDLVLPDHRCVILVLRHPAGLELDVEVVVLKVKLVHRIRLLQWSEQSLQALLHPDLIVSAEAQVCGHFAVHL